MVPGRTTTGTMPSVSLSRFWLFLAVALPVLAALLAPMSTVDLTYHLRAGAEILDTGAIPSVDTWTFTAAGLPWVDQQWGSQVILVLAERLGGWTGLALVRAVLSGVIFGCLVVIARRRGLDARMTALLVLIAFLVAAPAMALRPQLLGMACFAVVLLLIADRRTRPRGLWLVPVVVAVWANLHGSFFLGPLVLGLVWLEDLHDRGPSPHRALVVAAVSVVAACLTPFGPAVWVYAVGLSTNPEVTARITEWQPTSLRSVPGLLFFASALAVAAIIARRGRATSWPTLAWLAVFFAIGVVAQRGVAWWPLAAVVAVAGMLPASTLPSRDPRTDPPTIRRLNVVIVGALVLAGVALLPVWRPVDPGTGVPMGVLTHAPSGVTAALRDASGPGDHVFNLQTWGSWFEYALPDLPVAIDSRIELFPHEIWDTYAAVGAGVEGWEVQLQAWDVRFVAISPDQADFLDRLLAAGWTERYTGTDGVLLSRPEQAWARTIGAVTPRTGSLDSQP
jgi:hypothetical protein